MLRPIIHLFAIFVVFTADEKLVNIVYFSLASFIVLVVLGVDIIALVGAFVSVAFVLGTSQDDGIHIYNFHSSFSSSLRNTSFRFPTGSTTAKYFDVSSRNFFSIHCYFCHCSSNNDDCV